MYQKVKTRGKGALPDRGQQECEDTVVQIGRSDEESV